MTLGLLLFAVVELVGLLCAAHLWRQPAPRVKKLLWTPVLLFPLIGPLLYGALFETLTVQAEHERAQETTGARDYASSTHNDVHTVDRSRVVAVVQTKGPHPMMSTKRVWRALVLCIIVVMSCNEDIGLTGRGQDEGLDMAAAIESELDLMSQVADSRDLAVIADAQSDLVRTFDLAGDDGASCDDGGQCCPHPLPSPCVPGRYEYACAFDCPACGLNENCTRGLGIGGPPAEGQPCTFKGLDCEFPFGGPGDHVQCDCNGIAHHH